MAYGKFAGSALLALSIGIAAAGPPGSALYDAASRGDSAKVKALIAAGADVNYANPEDGSTPLIKAVEDGDSEMVEALIAAGADFAKKDHDGADAVEWASRYSRFDMVELIAQLVDPAHPGSVITYACQALPDGKPPLRIAVHTASETVSMQWLESDGSASSTSFYAAELNGAKAEWGTGIHGGWYTLDRATGRLEWNLSGAYSYLSTIGHLDGRTEADFKGVRQCRPI